MAEIRRSNQSISPIDHSLENPDPDHGIPEVDDAYGIKVIEESMNAEDMSEEQIFATLRGLDGTSV